MNTLKIALLQISPAAALSENLKKGMEACRKAKRMGADIAVFPEMWEEWIPHIRPSFGRMDS